MVLTALHDEIRATIKRWLDEDGFKYNFYADDEDDTDYHTVDGCSIKFWNVYPRSGDRLDALVIKANQMLAPHGLFLAYHLFTHKNTVLTNVVVPQKHGVRDVKCKGWVDKESSILSLLVKPLPKF